ncbi:MAG: hypothetical protein A2516_07995 [Alphaproteobacteria bacterium RIFOXYD12_FULL_60_8]|nr:MAG: hypothetical protein A2516_07995 [Alphaproteobacteria bacterium RIFOXYD12_FULL_60_8]
MREIIVLLFVIVTVLMIFTVYAATRAFQPIGAIIFITLTAALPLTVLINWLIWLRRKKKETREAEAAAAIAEHGEGDVEL